MSITRRWYAPQGTSTCTHVNADGNVCGDPATIHARMATYWGATTCDTFMVCDAHYLDNAHHGKDTHPMSPACGMPSAVWDTDGHRSFCHWPEGKTIAAEHHTTKDVPA